MRQITNFCFVLVILLTIAISHCNARSDRYYDMVNDIDEGINYYEVLGIGRDATASEIRKGFRQQALILHPDKGGEEAKYLAAVRASEILSDDEKREEYNELLDNGIPWQEEYYGKYAHKYGVPQTDIRYVLLGLVIIISGAQYLIRYTHWKSYDNIVKKMPMYQNKLKKARAPRGRFDDDNEDEDPGLNFVVVGAEKPELKDIFGVTLVLSPFYLSRWIYKVCGKVYREVILGQKPTLAELEKQMREKMGLDEEEWEEHKKKALDRQERFKQSTKYKRMMRYMKKN